ncbi:acetate--CoA ligase family protein [Desulfobacterales bacterium HSG16]|nr:acetate--CoA ligase family protein [Desulfobacterales bacterium HSG16]
MEFFFDPQSIALIGATANRNKGGYSILANLKKGFNGTIYPVNPKYPEIDGIQCYRSVADLPDTGVDLAIVFVPAKMVLDVIEACGKKGIKGVMIESGGFAESGPDGISLQNSVTKTAKKYGVRLWGPNCMGLVDAVNKNVFSFVSPAIWDDLIFGDVSLIVQSGMLSGAFLIDLMTHKVMGISKVCSIGNKMDVNECDLLEYLIHDDNTKVIGLYLESIPDGRKFASLCQKSEKPVVVLKGGRSEKGARAAMSHTASMSGNGAVISGALAQAGVIEAHDFRQMMDICRTISTFENLDLTKNMNTEKNSGKIAILTYSGGAGIISSDFMEELGLSLSDLSSQTLVRAKEVFPEWMPISNPVDLWPAVERNGAEKTYVTIAEAVMADPDVDAVFIHCFAGGFKLDPDIEALAKIASNAKKPMFCWLTGEQNAAMSFQIKAQKLGIPVFRELYRSLECMAALFSCHKNRGKIEKEPVFHEKIILSDDLLAYINIPDNNIDEHVAKKILNASGIDTIDEALAISSEDAGKKAEEMGYPVVMKGLLPQEVHKTELGLVCLNIDTEQKAADTFDKLIKKMNGKGSVLVQKQVQGDLELIVGMVRDPQFGPCVMCGFGGIFAEILQEAVFAVAPLSHKQASALIDRLKSKKILQGFRGQKPLDMDALANILVKLGRLGTDFDNIAEIDINPLIISKGVPVAVDAAIVTSRKLSTCA